MPLPTDLTLRKIARLDASSANFHDQLDNALHGREYQECVPKLQDDDLVWLVDYLDKVLDGLDPSSPASRKCLHELTSACSTRAILPTPYTLSSDLLNIGSDPFASGYDGDVYLGTFSGSKVYVKRVRVHVADGSQKDTKVFYREAVVWKHLKHRNILPLLGVTITSPQLISSQIPGETLPEYIKSHPSADRLGLLSGVAEGLSYLHSCNVIHGGIHGLSVLVDDSGHALITDFCRAKVFIGENSVGTYPGPLDTIVRWTAPEVLNGGASNKESDIFSFAMVVIEVFTGTVPFSDDTTLIVMVAMTQGRRPPRPKYSAVTGRLWKLIQCCWDQVPESRPEAAEVLKELIACNPPAWKKLIGHGLSTEERTALITSIFSDRDEVGVFKYLSTDDAQAFVDVVDEMLDGLPQQIYRRCLRYLYRICGHHALLPNSLQIPLCYDPKTTAECGGGFADVWKGKHRDQDVAAKALKVYTSYTTEKFEKIRKTFCREIMTWRTLRHPNVLPLIGVTMTDTVTEKRFVMVSRWMNNRNINKFLESNTNVDRLQLLREITTGLIYMHDHGMIHGDLKGDNILIDGDGHALLADFSLITLIPDRSTFLSSCIQSGTVPWMSPELLEPGSFGLKEIRPTRESDCYALGMVVYEILSGRAPFGGRSDFGTVFKVLNGERPARPQGEGAELFADVIWEVLERCWKRKPSDRASVEDVLQCLGGTPSDVDAETDSGDQSDATPDDS